jgi:hypothetical protein
MRIVLLEGADAGLEFFQDINGDLSDSHASAGVIMEALSRDQIRRGVSILFAFAYCLDTFPHEVLRAGLLGTLRVEREFGIHRQGLNNDDRDGRVMGQIVNGTLRGGYRQDLDLDDVKIRGRHSMGNAVIRPEDDADAVDMKTTVQEMREMVVDALTGDVSRMSDFFVTLLARVNAVEGERLPSTSDRCGSSIPPRVLAPRVEADVQADSAVIADHNGDQPITPAPGRPGDEVDDEDGTLMDDDGEGAPGRRIRGMRLTRRERAFAEVVVRSAGTALLRGLTAEPPIEWAGSDCAFRPVAVRAKGQKACLESIVSELVVLGSGACNFRVFPADSAHCIKLRLSEVGSWTIVPVGTFAVTARGGNDVSFYHKPLSVALEARLGPEFDVDAPIASVAGASGMAMISPPIAKRVRKRGAITQLPPGRVVGREAGLSNGCLCCFASAVVQLLGSDANFVRGVQEHVESGAADEQDALLLKFLLGGQLCERDLADAHGFPPGFGDPVAFLLRVLGRQLASRPWVDQVAGFRERGRGEGLLVFQGSETAGLTARFAAVTSPQDVLFVVNSTPPGMKVDVNRVFHVDYHPFALRSFVAHIGPQMETHDVAFIRAQSGGWFCADDNVVLGYADRRVVEIFAGGHALVRPVVLCFS